MLIWVNKKIKNEHHLKIYQEKNKSKEEYTIIVNELNTLKSTLEQKEKDIDSLSKEKEELEKDNTVKISLVKDNYEKEANDLKNTIASQDYLFTSAWGALKLYFNFCFFRCSYFRKFWF